MSSQYILEMNHIEKEFFGNKVLKDVSLRVKPGDIVALIGENGRVVAAFDRSQFNQNLKDGVFLLF